MPSCMILRIFIGIIINSCCSNSSVLLPLELVVQFVISAFQCFTSVFIRCLSSSHSFWNIGYSFYIKFSVPSVSHFALEDSPELDSTEESHSFFKFPVSTLLQHKLVLLPSRFSLIWHGCLFMLSRIRLCHKITKHFPFVYGKTYGFLRVWEV